jgi:hypothetical protein
MKALRFVLMLIGLVVVLKFFYASWFTTPLDDDLRVTRLPLSTEPGKEPWVTKEPFLSRGRNSARERVLDALAMPQTKICTPEGRKYLVDAFVIYYGTRAREEREYKQIWGDRGASYIAQTWKTADDGRAERLTRDVYARGYFSLDHLQRYAGTKDKIAGVVQGERAARSPCPGDVSRRCAKSAGADRCNVEQHPRGLSVGRPAPARQYVLEQHR